MVENPSLVRDFAHEIRNAISPIRSAADLLRLRGADANSLPRILATIERSLDSALQTIDVFANADRAMTGAVQLSLARVRVKQLVERAIGRISAHLQPQSQRIESAAIDETLEVFADIDASAQMLAAMFDEARRTTSQGAAIELSVRSDGGPVELRVRCRGPVRPAELESMFDTFRVYGAAGRMALRTARRLAELQHGQLFAESDASSGSAELVLTMPLPAVDQPPMAAGELKAPRAAMSMDGNVHAAVAPAAQRGDSHPLRIMIVDDNSVIRSAYREALEELGYEVLLAADGEEALRVAEDAAPDVALIDIHLPTLNGYQVARALRARQASKPIHLVMLSGMALDDTMKRLSQSAGFDNCIDKGAGPRALDALLRSR